MARQGIAVAIGLDAVDPAPYTGWRGVLKAGVSDARAMLDLARARSFAASSLLDAQATRDAVLRAIGDATVRLRSGDIFLLTFSGHGIQRPNDVGLDLELDGDDETWCLYDGLLFDDEINGALIGFLPGVRVVIVSDSCSSETVFESPAHEALAAEVSAAEVRRGDDHPLVRLAPHNLADPIFRKKRGEYVARLQALPARPATRVRAAVVLLAACRDRQRAYEVNGQGVFTRALLEAWADGAFAGTYDDFVAAIRTRVMDPRQEPSLGVLGEGTDALRRERPFTIPPAHT